MTDDRFSRRNFLKTSGLSSGLAFVAPGLGETEARAAPPPAVGTPISATITINGAAHRLMVEPRVSLLDLLRERLDLTGTKKGCNEGACGACTVLLDGKRVNACLTLAVQCDGRAVTTVEGLSRASGGLHPVQQAFIDHDAFQCGYCTAGQVVSAAACIAEGHATDEHTVREWMSGNLCRCSSYPQITAAVLDAAARLGKPPRALGHNPALEG